MHLILLSVVLLLSVFSHGKDGHAFNLSIENDTRNIGGPGSDNAYTSGFKIAYVYAPDRTPRWALPFVEFTKLSARAGDTAATNFSLALGHQIYTPNDIAKVELIPEDRPYAAWLYVGIIAQLQEERKSQVIEFDIGYIGPEAIGEPVQNLYHRAAGVDPAQGWNNQLGSEPTLQLTYQQRQKFFALKTTEKRNYLDIIPFFGAAFGNIAINAYAGTIVRLGTNLPGDFGPTRSSSPEGETFLQADRKKWHDSDLYYFISARVTGVGRNIFLDGNTFHSGPRVHKIPVIGETEIGVGALFYNWNMTWSFVSRSPEFRERSNYNSFAAIKITRTF